MRPAIETAQIYLKNFVLRESLTHHTVCGVDYFVVSWSAFLFCFLEFLFMMCRDHV